MHTEHGGRTGRQRLMVLGKLQASPNPRERLSTVKNAFYPFVIVEWML